MILPPKRYESDSDPKYDSIRFAPWFHKLAERREKIPDLEGARLRWRSLQSKMVGAQKAAAEACNVDERELRDYIAFYDGEVKHDRTDQQILNEAYAIYCHHKGKIMLKACLDQIAPLYGRSSRQVFESYDTDRTFYPTGYVNR